MQISLTGCKQKKILCKAFRKAKNYQYLTTESGFKQRFTLLQEKVVIQAVCRMNQAVRMKARFFNQYFLSYVKKLQGGQIAPPQQE